MSRRPPGHCVFCDVVAGELSARVVAETDDTLAFLDHRPVFEGHVLVVPREHHDTLVDLPPGQIAPFFAEVQRVARAVEIALDADGTFVGINTRVSQSVPHLHAHVVPRRRKDGLRGFFWPRRAYPSDEQALAVRDAIRAAILRTPG